LSLLECTKFIFYIFILNENFEFDLQNEEFKLFLDSQFTFYELVKKLFEMGFNLNS
jgi:hypothetical protein